MVRVARLIWHNAYIFSAKAIATIVFIKNDFFLQQQHGFRHERTHETLPFRDGLEAFYGAVLRRERSS